MNAILKKLNYKKEKSLLVLQPPAEFEEVLIDFGQYLTIERSVSSKPVEFALVFCTKLQEVEEFSQQIDQVLIEDGLFWFAYPKGSSKRYKCEFNRDNGWLALGALGYEPVRMVALDDDWSALRFRKAKNIKTISRNPDHILSEEGKNKSIKK